MKFTHLFVAGVMALSAAGIMSCSGSNKGAETDTDSLDMAEVTVLSVDELLANPSQYEGDTVTVKGLCSHLCKHGGTKAFLENPDTAARASLLMCVATDLIGGSFDASCPEKEMTVSGIVTPNVVTVSDVDAMIAKHEQEVKEGHCNAEVRSGNYAFDMKARLDSMVALNPADTALTVGYYIETLSYALPQ